MKTQTSLHPLIAKATHARIGGDVFDIWHVHDAQGASLLFKREENGLEYNFEPVMDTFSMNMNGEWTCQDADGGEEDVEFLSLTPKKLKILL